MSEGVEKLSHAEAGIKTSNFYNQTKLKAFSVLIKTRADQFNAKSSPIQVIKQSTKPPGKLSKKQKNCQKDSPMSAKGSGLKRKTKDVVSDFERLTNCKASDITDLHIGKQTLGKMDGKAIEQGRKCKKIKLDLNKNFPCQETCLSQRKLFTKVKPNERECFQRQKVNGSDDLNAVDNTVSLNMNDNNLVSHEKNLTENSNLCKNDLINLSDSEESLDETDQKRTELRGSCCNNKTVLTSSRQENTVFIEDSETDIFASPISCCLSDETELSQSNGTSHDSPIITRKAKSQRNGSLDAFVIKEKTRTSSISEKVKDSGFHEPFTIVGEMSLQEDKNCSSRETSPLLFSQSSFSGSARSESASPECQSSITKYFTPVGKSNSIAAVLKNNNVSPSSDKKGKWQRKGRKINSPTDSPVSNKKEQMFLDLGQKNFGHITCPTCKMVYTRAQPEDEAYHVKFHHKVVSSLRFKGWKTERVVEHFDDGRVIVVLPQDAPAHLNKVASVRTVVDDELGFSSEASQRMQESKTYLFIAGKKVVGCVVAVVIQEAFPILPLSTSGEKNEISEQGAWCCSSVPVPAQCGISRIWVLQQYRRKKIATRILDCVRNDFMFGGVVSKEMLAFSDPTPHGKKLAESYCGTQHFLVFR